MKIDFYFRLLMICPLLYCIAQCEYENFENEDPSEDKHEEVCSAEYAAKIVRKRDTTEYSDPLPNAGDQLSIFNSLLNSVLLAESIGRNLTTFGEIGVNFMLEHIPVDKNGISLIDSKDIHMEDLQKVMENGFDGNVSIDVIEKLMVVQEGISAIDALVKAFEAVEKVKTEYNKTIVFNPNVYSKELLFLGSLPRIFSTLSTDSIDYLKTGAELIKNFSTVNIEAIKSSYTSCEQSISSDECVAGFEVFQKMPFEKIDDIEALAVAIELINSKDKVSTIPDLIKDKDVIKSMHKNLLNFQNLIGSPVNFKSPKDQFSAMFLALSDLKAKTSELQELAKALKVFQPVSEVIVKMHNGHQESSHKRIRKANEHSTSVIETIRRLPYGIFSLDKLSKKTQKGAALPNEYQNSKLKERTKIIGEFTRQRVDFLELSKGVGSIHYISKIIKNIELFFNNIPSYTSLNEEIGSIFEDKKKLAAVKGIADGIIALEDIETRLEPLNENNWKNVTDSFDEFKVTFNRDAFFELFSALAKVLRSAKRVDNLMKTNGKVDKKIFDEAIEAAANLSATIENHKNLAFSIKDNDIVAMKSMITKLNPKSFNLENRETSIGTIVDGLNSAYNAHDSIITTISTLSNHSQFESSSTELKKLNTDVPKRPSQKELDAFKPMMTQLSSLEKLEISSQIENQQLCPYLTNLINSQNSDLLGDVSKGLIQYWRLIQGIPSIAYLQSENVDASIKELLIGVEAIQIVAAKQGVGAYDLFYSSQLIDEQLEKLVKYIDTTVKAISSKNLKSTIKEKAESYGFDYQFLNYGFLNRLDGSVVTSMKNLRSSISVILMELKDPIGCDEIEEWELLESENDDECFDVVLCCQPCTAMWKIVFPLIIPPIAGCFLLVSFFAMVEYYKRWPDKSAEKRALAAIKKRNQKKLADLGGGKKIDDKKAAVEEKKPCKTPIMSRIFRKRAKKTASASNTSKSSAKTPNVPSKSAPSSSTNLKKRN